jgi:hypothetical protein
MMRLASTGYLDLVRFNPDRGGGQTVGLILDVGGQTLQLGKVLPAMVGAEQQLAT